jgi:hypothetical protein
MAQYIIRMGGREVFYNYHWYLIKLDFGLFIVCCFELLEQAVFTKSSLVHTRFL